MSFMQPSTLRSPVLANTSSSVPDASSQYIDDGQQQRGNLCETVGRGTIAALIIRSPVPRGAWSAAERDHWVSAPHVGQWANFEAENTAGHDSLLNVTRSSWARFTYERFFESWAHTSGRAYIDLVNAMLKYVPSRSLNASVLGPRVRRYRPGCNAQRSMSTNALGAGTELIGSRDAGGLVRSPGNLRRRSQIRAVLHWVGLCGNQRGQDARRIKGGGRA
jgi:hypothetical protein